MEAVQAADAATGSAGSAVGEPGPLEEYHSQFATFRNACNTTRLTSTHWHIAWANGLGWTFDGMDGAIFSLVAPMVMKEFNVPLGSYRTGVQVSAMVGILGLYFWPWLADRIGRRTLLAVNIAMFSLLMPVVAMSPSWIAYIAAYGLVRFALNGEWALGTMLVAETWPARLRGRVISVDRSAWGIGASLGGVIAAFVVAVWGWRAAFIVPGVLALLAIYVRWLCPESPYWVRTQDRKNRIKARQQAGLAVDAEDQDWISRAGKVGIRQLFLPDMLVNTLLATFVATAASIAFSTIGLWMPLFLSETHHWSAAEYGNFYIWWGLFGTWGYWVAGWISDHYGRRLAFAIMLIEASVFLTFWAFAEGKVALWTLGLLWNWGVIGVWGPVCVYTAEMFPTRVRGVGNGFAWVVGVFVGSVLWPFVAVWLRQETGSFAAAFLLIPVIMLVQGAVIWFWSPEHAGKELDAIAV
jgi:MFS family permease